MFFSLGGVVEAGAFVEVFEFELQGELEVPDEKTVSGLHGRRGRDAFLLEVSPVGALEIDEKHLAVGLHDAGMAFGHACAVQHNVALESTQHDLLLTKGIHPGGVVLFFDCDRDRDVHVAAWERESCAGKGHTVKEGAGVGRSESQVSPRTKSALTQPTRAPPRMSVG